MQQVPALVAIEFALAEDVQRRILNGGSTGEPTSDRLCRETGSLLLPGDHHTLDFLEPDRDRTPGRHAPFHGSPDARRQTAERLRRILAGELPWEEHFAHSAIAWERPMDLVAAMVRGEATPFEALNLVNEGQVPDLPQGVFVETPCVVDADGPRPRTMALPAIAAKLCGRTAAVTDAIVRAAVGRDRRLLHEAVELDPTITDKAAGIRAVNACLEAHADILPAYA